MASLFLNVKGRVIAETIITNLEEGNYLIECDISVTEKLKAHVTKFKLRNKFEMSESPHKVYVQFLPENSSPDLSNLSFIDPRTSNLGVRVYSEAMPSVQDDTLYQKMRILSGVPESVIDVPPEDCFPLEINYDKLSGISWSKGCYLGQELTARTYHVGVVRTRMLPIQSDRPIQGNQIFKNGKVIGEIRSRIGNLALAKVKLDEIFQGELITENQSQVVPLIPFWYDV